MHSAPSLWEGVLSLQSKAICKRFGKAVEKFESKIKEEQEKGKDEVGKEI